MMKKILCLALLCLALFSFQAKAEEHFDAAAKHAIAVEANTGKILYEKDATSPAGIASITKILTIYLVYKEIKAGDLTWNTKVKISNYPYGLTTDYSASNVPMEAREYTVKQLVDASMIASANSAAIALAEKIGGTEPKFVDMMKKQLQDWGITDAKLVNASGLNNKLLGDHIYPGSETDEENMMSAKDVAIIARHLIKDFPQILKITKKTSEDFAGTKMDTYNYMLPNMPYAREGVDGLKTGTTEFAGASFVATAKENGMRIISVVLNANNSDTDDSARFKATNDLLNYVSNTYERTTLIRKGQAYKNSTAKVIDGKKSSVSAVAKENLVVIQTKTSSQKKAVIINSKKEGYTAAVQKGQSVGEARFKDSNLVGQGYLDSPPTVKLVAKTEVKRSFFLKVWWNHFVRYVNEKL
ncbi:putative D-alanyl-D-alanine carboxypeptidase [Streptococcus mutans]|nr:D-alanyl-D-alanine carboxypeptidase PBP3 [Streptococcus ratti]QEY06872.1 D-alanyl-D-alanine carboxypeptidase [Streptococcus ratti]VEI59289.1 putative D-alanyl-D-alanine carboxypeptidase [Streptococcus mutans]